LPGLIVHEWIEQSGGAEKVVDAFTVAFPDADIRCLWNDAPGRYPNSRVTESWLAKTPLRRNKVASMPFMFPTWAKVSTDQDYDWLLVSSHVFAHQARLKGQRDIPKFVYVHTPARYLWEPQLDSRGSSFLARAAGHVLKPLDRSLVTRSANFAANSKFVSDRVSRAWGVESSVIYPPVDVDRILQGGDWQTRLGLDDAERIASIPDEYVIGASRFVPYKRLEHVLKVAEVAGLPAVLAGSGPDLERLQALASGVRVPVHFVKSPSDELLFSLIQGASLFVFPGIEDFGIIPVEAMALGTPVLVNVVGGAAESVIHGKTGAHVADWDNRSEVEAALGLAMASSSVACQTRAADFDSEISNESVITWIGRA
jgi:glycosyltransferase involved in cell wall biosynthesis